MRIKKSSTFLLCALIMSLGILGSGYFLGKSFYKSKLLNRSVSVKGLAERDVVADLGIWEVDYREVGSDLVELNKRLEHNQEVVIAFLKSRGFKNEELSLQPVRVEDRLANVYSQPGATNDTSTRYVVTSGIRVRSSHVNLIQQVNQLSSSLLQQGVAIIFDTTNINPNPSYYFTQLDKIRPEIIAEATRSARTVAEQFAKDSGAKLRGILHASQGVFQIMGRDSSVMSADWNRDQAALGSIDKKVRLVTSLEYQLK